MTEVEKIIDIAFRLQRAAEAYTEVRIDADFPFDINVTELKEAYLKKIPGETEEDALARALVQVLVTKWRRYKTAYQFSPEFIDILMDSESPEIHVELLRRLPVRSFFVYSPSEQGLGFFLDFEFYKDGAVRCSMYHISAYNEKIPNLLGSHLAAVVFDGESLDAVVEREAKDAMWTDDEKEGGLILLKDNLKRALMCAYYLAAKNADLKPVRVRKENRPRLSSGNRLNVKQWDVGFRVARQFEETFRVTPGEGKGVREGMRKAPPRPHVRRAHWHHYWTGPGRTVLEVRWLEPVLVMGSPEDLPTVSRDVLGKD